jgi:hypothetical protein
MVASLWPQAMQRAHCRSMSLDAAPRRITGTAHARERMMLTLLAVDPHPRRRAAQIA